MLLIRTILYFSASLIILYPSWGLIDPAAFSNQLTETFANAKQASDTQIRQASLVFMLLNLLLSISLVFIAKFISNPSTYVFAKIAAVSLVAYPFVSIVGDIAMGFILSQQTQDATLTTGLSHRDFIYIVLGLAISGISKSQHEHNQKITNN